MTSASAFEIDADEIAPSLRWATAVVTKTPRARGRQLPAERSTGRRCALQRTKSLRLR